MVILKNKIKTVSSLPPEQKKKIAPTSILITVIITIIIGLLLFITYKNTLPYINAVNIKNIVGKKTFITKCNTKDYIIIGKDKSYSLSLTNDNCETKYFEGTLTIKNNQIIFEKNITGTIDNNYNIIINNSLFESENNKTNDKNE